MKPALTPAAWDCLGVVGDAWGLDWGRVLRDCMTDGTIAELDGEPVLQPRQMVLSGHEQMRLGE